MITYTDEVKPVRRYSKQEIMSMPPGKLRKELSRLCAFEPDMSGKIEGMVFFEPRWNTMTVVQYAMVALAWAYLEEQDDDIAYQLDKALECLARLK